MKLTKLSLLAIMALSSSSYAADTLAEAFKDGKVNGSIKAMYWDREIPAGEASLLTMGLRLGYETASLNGLVFRAEAQSSSSPFADDEAKTVFGKTAFGGDMYGPGAVLSEANLSYTLYNTNLRVGRMYLDTPVVASSGNRMIKQSFEAATIVNKDLENTILTAAYVQKFQDRTDGAGNIPDFNKFNDDGAYALSIETKIAEGLDLTLAYLDNIDVTEVIFAQVNYDMGMFDVGAQYYYSEDEGQDDTNLITFKAGVKVGDAYFHGAYSKVDDDGKVQFGLGGGADRAYAGSLIYSPNYDANTETYQVGATYDISDNAFVKAMYTQTDDDINEYSYVSFLGRYAFSGSLKGLSAVVLLEDEGKDGDKKDWRFNLSYDF